MVDGSWTWSGGALVAAVCDTETPVESNVVSSTDLYIRPAPIDTLGTP